MKYIVERLRIPTDDSIATERVDGTEVVRLSSMLFLSHQWNTRVMRLLQNSKYGKTNWIKHKMKARALAYSPPMVDETFDKTKLKRSLSAPKFPGLKTVPYVPADHLGPVSDSEVEFPKIPVGKLDYDTQFLAAFRVCIWIVRRPAKELTNKQRSALLLQALKSVNQLQSHTVSVDAINSLVTDGRRDLLEICVCVLALADKELLEALDSLLKTMKAPTFPEQLQSFLKSKGFETMRQ